MKQAITISPGQIEFREVEKPRPLLPNDILLRIKRIGICGSDVHVWHGKHPFTSYPIVQGHEYSGVVEAVGEKVVKVVVGDLVTARPQMTCDVCDPCKRGDYNICQELKVQGFQSNGSAQEFFIVPEERVVKIPDCLSLNESAMVEPVAVGAHSTKRPSFPIKGENVVVFGAGTIGNIVAQFAKARGAKNVLITDLNDFRLEKARECGIVNTTNSLKEAFPDAIDRVFGHEGFRLAFEAAGAESPIQDAVENLRNGGEIIILGVFDRSSSINMALVCEHELKLIGSMMYTLEDYHEAVEFLSGQKINVKPLVTGEFEFNELDKAYRHIDVSKGEALKIIINMDGAHEHL